MKIRTGFVSNSSSSSFLVWFTTMPKNAEELRTLLFGNKQEIEEYDYVVPTDVAAGIIWHDLQNQAPITMESMRDELRSLAYSNVYHARGQRGKNNLWLRVKDPKAQRSLRCKEEAETEAEVETELSRLVEECRQHKGQVYRFHYSDNDGEIYTVLEHGDVFQNLEHVRISHH